MSAKPAKTIVVVDDSITIRELLSRMLGAAGYKVTAISDAEEALNAIGREPPDLVISDISMPGRDGFWLCREVKWRLSGKRIPVVLFTRLDEPAEILKGLSVGADAFILKNSPGDELVDRIERLLDDPAAERRKSAITDLGRGLALTREHEHMFKLLHESLDRELKFDILAFLLHREEGILPLICVSWAPFSPELEAAVIDRVLKGWAPLVNRELGTFDVKPRMIVARSDRWPLGMEHGFHGLQVPLAEGKELMGQISVFTFKPELRMESEIQFLFEAGLTVGRALRQLEGSW